MMRVSKLPTVILAGLIAVLSCLNLAWGAKRNAYIEGMYSQTLFDRIVARDPDNYAVRYLRGMLYLNSGNGNSAIDEWEQFVRSAPVDERSMTVRERLTILKQAQARAFAKVYLKKDPNRLVQEIGSNTVGIMNFYNRGSRRFNALSKGLTGMITTDLLKVPRLTVVERERMQALFQEMRLRQADLAVPDRTLRFGRLLMAQYLIWGEFFDNDEQSIQITCSVTNTKNASLLMHHQVKGPLKDFIRLEKQLTFRILETIGISKEHLSPTVLEALNQFHTHDINAFLAYSEGLEQLDRGNFQMAKENFQQASSMDPQFRMAREAMQATPDDRAFAELVENMEILQFRVPRPHQEGEESQPDQEPLNGQRLLAKHPHLRNSLHAGGAMETHEEIRVDPETGQPMPVDKEASVTSDGEPPMEMQTDQQIKTENGLPIDPNTGLPFDPDTGQLFNPQNGEPIPMEQFENDPEFRQRIIEMIHNRELDASDVFDGESLQIGSLIEMAGFNGQEGDQDREPITADGVFDEPQPVDDSQFESQTIQNQEDMPFDYIDPDIVENPQDIPRQGFIITPVFVRSSINASLSFKAYVFNSELQDLNGINMIRWGTDNAIIYNGEGPHPLPVLTELQVNGNTIPVEEMQFELEEVTPSVHYEFMHWYTWTLSGDISIGETGEAYLFDQSGYTVFGASTPRERYDDLAANSIAAVYKGIARGILLKDASSIELSGYFSASFNFNTGTFSDFKFSVSSAAAEDETPDYRLTFVNGTGKFLDNHFEVSAGTWLIADSTISGEVTADIRGAFYGPDAQHIGGIWSVQGSGTDLAYGVFAGTQAVGDAGEGSEEITDADTRQGLMIGQLYGGVLTEDGNVTENDLARYFYTADLINLNEGGAIDGGNESFVAFKQANDATVVIDSFTYNDNPIDVDGDIRIEFTPADQQNDFNAYLTWGTWKLSSDILLAGENGTLSMNFREPNYYLFGQSTPEDFSPNPDDYTDTANGDISAKYSGFVSGTLGKTDQIALDNGSYSALVNFSTGSISEFNLNAWNAIDENQFVSITDASGTMETNFPNFSINSHSGIWEINGISPDRGDVRGAFFGTNAEAMGGIWYLEGGGENQASGIFAGQREIPGTTTAERSARAGAR